MFIEWIDERHSIGIPIIDNQHKELFLITNQLHDILGLEHYQKEALKILKKLYAYTSYHFVSEEALLREYKYPEMNDHIKNHNSFREKIKEYLENVREKQNFPLETLQDYLVEWILKHIQGSDVKYAEFFRETSIIPQIHFSVSEKTRSDVMEQWQKQKLELEIIGIDNQHKELIYILQQTNDLQHTSEARKKLFLPVIFEKLLFYSQYHFSFEEEHMSKNAYPLIKEQQDLHKEFINRVIRFSEDYKAGMIDLTDDIILFLKNWVINHILTEDKKYKVYLEKNLKEQK